MDMRQPQPHFAFKQFAIRQDRCAMKVSTDACIQGAWIPLLPHTNKVLDVGTGTGLLALMLAQRASQLTIDALEIDADAAMQAAENISASSFAERIQVINEDARSFDPGRRYDLIVCNPPFFSQDLTGPDAHRNNVRHDAHLKAKDIVSLAGRVLANDGALSVMWPERRTEAWAALMKAAGFGLTDELTVRNNSGARISSVISIWKMNTAAKPCCEQLFIRDDDGIYSKEFTALLKGFYLRL